MAALRTEFPFTLPKGLVDSRGQVHRDGVMRLATARDELDPLNDPKVRDADDPYLTVIVLSRVVVRLGDLTRLSPRDIEGMFAADLAYLQDVYAAINYGSEQDIERTLAGPARPVSPVAPSSPNSPGSAAPLAAPTGALTRQDPPAAAPPVVPATTDADEEPAVRVDDEGIELPTPRRNRIEEVGRSTGRPDRR